MAPGPAQAENEWDDEDEKTTVFDRSHEESAQALLQKAPTPAAGVPASKGSAPPPPPPGAMSARPVPSPFAPAPSAPLVSARPPAPPVPSSVARPVPSQPMASAPAASVPMQSAPVVPMQTRSSKTSLFIGMGAVAAIAVGGYVFLGGSKPGGLLISVAGPGGTAVKEMTVTVDGKPVDCVDSTCKVEELEPGSYVVKATAAGYAEMAGKAYEIKAGERKAINIELVSEAGSTGLKVSSKAPGLSLTVDGKKIGALPQELPDLKPGDHVVELTGSPFIKEFKETVTVKEGETLEFEPKLELIKGQVNIKLDDSAKDAKVVLVVNGKRRSLASTIKKATSDTVKIDLPVEGKTYVISATRKGYEDFEEQLVFSVEEPVRTVDLTLTEEGSEPSPGATKYTGTQPSPGPSPSPAPGPAPAAAASGQGKLNINSIPVSNIILDGRPLGSTPKLGVSVSAGAHTVVFVHPEHGRKSRTVTVSGGEVATAAVRFP